MRSSIRNIIYILLLCILFVTPDIIYSLISSSFKVSNQLVTLLLLIPLSAGLVLNPYRLLSITILSILMVLQLMQFFHIAYIGKQISPFALYLMQNEMSDVLNEAKHVFFKYAYLIPIVVIPFLFISVLIKKTTKHKVGGVILIALFVFDGTRLYMSRTSRFNPNESRITLDNSINAMFGYFIIKLKNYEVPNYLDYKVIDTYKNDDEEINIVYIMGESINYNHMSLFGYEKDTTPKLKELSKQENFYYTKGISGAISTIASSKFMMNVIREPNNIKLTSSDKTSLFSLAKQHGFKTFYLSAQEDDIVAAVAPSDAIDVLVTKGNLPTKSKKTKDESLFDVFEKQTLSKKNFIVFHERALHSPYEKTIPEEYNKNPVFEDKYDNALSYLDYLISKTFNLFNQRKGKFYIILTSDHNESRGENGVFGHLSLIPQAGNVPMLFQSNDKEFLKKIRSIFSPTHYEIGKVIANVIGFQIENPNEKDNIFYINGVDYNGRCGYIKFRKDLENRMIKYIKE